MVPRGEAGACFVKWAQVVRDAVGFVSTRCVTRFAGLQAGAPAHSRRHTKRLVEDAVGCQIDDYFDSFERKPIAPGVSPKCTGQRAKARS